MVVNFTGTTAYDFQKTGIYKESRDGLIVANLFVYVDDGRPIVPKEKYAGKFI